MNDKIEKKYAFRPSKRLHQTNNGLIFIYGYKWGSEIEKASITILHREMLKVQIREKYFK